MTDPKYQCLVDAVANSGLTLPPIAPDGAVEEQDTSPPNIPQVITGEGVDFTYRQPNGKTFRVDAYDILDHIKGRSSDVLKQFSHVKSFGLYENGDWSTNVFASINPDLKWESLGDKAIIPGTTEETINRILQCRYPPMS
jgi:hypothetical protein